MLQKILDMVTTNGYIKSISKEGIKYLKVGPTGLLLQNNLKTQWFNNIVVNKEVTVFPSKGNIQVTFEYAKKMCSEKVPFGIAETIKPKVNDFKLKRKNQKSETKKTGKLKDFFEEEDQIELQSTIFVPSQTSVQFFHQWQRQRKMWWKKVGYFSYILN